MFLVFLHFPTLFSFSSQLCYSFLFISLVFVVQISTTQHNTHIQHTTYTIHNHTQHTIPTIHSTSHYITSHHITFCTCLVLILVMPSVSGQAVVVWMSDFSMKIVRFVPFCFLVSDFCWIAWFSSLWRGVFGPERS